MKTRKKLISIVSPAYNEEKNVSQMVDEVTRVMKSLSSKYDYEYILVDDGSCDGTWGQILKEARKNKKIRGLSLSRNFGQQMAITAGLDLVKGEAVIYLDSDLQQPPQLFPKLLEKWERGAMIVHTLRVESGDKRIIKAIFSRLFYTFANLLSDTQIKPGMADFKLLDKKVYSKLNAMRERSRFLRGMVPWLGFKSDTVAYKAGKRNAGTPWYTLRRNITFAKDGILAISTKPLILIGYLGMALTAASFIAMVASFVIMAMKSDFRYISPVLILVMFNTFLFGIVLSSLGVVALYISYLHKEIINRPLYLVDKKINVKR
jgi:glycosyltransferase involved in cell wall biosynthesis